MKRGRILQDENDHESCCNQCIAWNEKRRKNDLARWKRMDESKDRLYDEMLHSDFETKKSLAVNLINLAMDCRFKALEHRNSFYEAYFNVLKTVRNYPFSFKWPIIFLIGPLEDFSYVIYLSEKEMRWYTIYLNYLMKAPFIDLFLCRDKELLTTFKFILKQIVIDDERGREHFLPQWCDILLQSFKRDAFGVHQYFLSWRTFFVINWNHVCDEITEAKTLRKKYSADFFPIKNGLHDLGLYPGVLEIPMIKKTFNVFQE
jgi:hypothetical protein